MESVGQNMGGSLFRKEMSKQSTYESGQNPPSNGGSTIRFGGSFKKNSKTSHLEKGENPLYSEIKPKPKGSSSIISGSNIKVQNIDSDEDDPMSFLEDLIHQNNGNNLGTMSHHRRNPEMHKDAEYALRQYYDDSPLTVVSEEASTRQTVILGNNLSKKYSQFGLFPFESDINSSPSPISGQGTSQFQNPKMCGNFDGGGGKSAISGGSGGNMINSDFRMNRTKSAFLNPNNPKNDFPKKRSHSKKAQPKSMTEMDDILEQSRNENSQDSGNLIPQSPIMRVSSEGTTTIQKRTFLPDNEKKNKFFGKLTPLVQPQIAENNSDFFEESELILKNQGQSSLKFGKKWESLPDQPFAPNFQISLLKNVENKKAIHKKSASIENLIFKLSEEGLYYDGGLSFGKLTGNGMLLLTMVDTSNPNSLEVKNNLLYKGNFANNRVQGKGVLFFKNGAKFEGTFQNGVAHGAGKLYRSDGEILSGIWIEGNFNI